jgi:hypothetical protein
MNERERARLVGTCSSAMSHGEQSLEQVPVLLYRILKEEVWRDFETQLGKKIHHARFIDFVTMAPPAGLGSTIEHIANFIKGNKEAEDLLGLVIQNPVGRPKTVYNIHSLQARPSGTSGDRALRMLREKKPELHQRVLSGELSRHAAMIEAGYRPRTITVNPDNPKSAATLIAKASPAFLEELRKLLDAKD